MQAPETSNATTSDEEMEVIALPTGENEPAVPCADERLTMVTLLCVRPLAVSSAKCAAAASIPGRAAREAAAHVRDCPTGKKFQVNPF
jgi:hypothetical protein